MFHLERAIYDIERQYLEAEKVLDIAPESWIGLARTRHRVVHELTPVVSAALAALEGDVHLHTMLAQQWREFQRRSQEAIEEFHHCCSRAEQRQTWVKAPEVSAEVDPPKQPPPPPPVRSTSPRMDAEVREREQQRRRDWEEQQRILEDQQRLMRQSEESGRRMHQRRMDSADLVAWRRRHGL